jgi:hypothetical protein
MHVPVMHAVPTGTPAVKHLLGSVCDIAAQLLLGKHDTMCAYNQGHYDTTKCHHGRWKSDVVKHCLLALYMSGCQCEHQTLPHSEVVTW